MRDKSVRREDLACELFELQRYVSERAHTSAPRLMDWIDAACLEEMHRLTAEFATNISHEMRTPLGNIKLFASLLQNGAPEKHARYIEILRQEADRLRGLVENLLSLSRFERDDVALHIESIDLNQLAGAAMAQHTPLAVAQEIGLEYQLDSERPQVQGDAQLTVQALSHLICNALMFTPADGSIVVRTRSAMPAGWGEVSVEDSGPGIAEHEQPLVFEPFYRGRAALERGVPGAGLGLALSKQIIERMGGWIGVQSTLGAGATFVVRLRSV